ncbi:MAG: GNAT family protein [Alicyclobacillaceae bacterium]|jgi:hypothetical protein|uniref:GNAT family N-acetyltransferase n=1 Tax=Alicyclobacillus sp. SP_1 TaxID=2942475 RepID=UPI00215765E4|nr:GNAT family protein [Alicyclobacillus sp. SP_1]MCY0888583.1 GNAT family protein [Alicyclobacillaceae bacterium]
MHHNDKFSVSTTLRDNPLEFYPLSFSLLLQMHTTYCEDPTWPKQWVTLEHISEWFLGLEFDRTAATADAFAIFTGGKLLGLAHIHLMPPAPNTRDGSMACIEGGTYLLPEARGNGWNPMLKHRLLRIAFQDMAADATLFFVPIHHTQARKAWDKLPEHGCLLEAQRRDHTSPPRFPEDLFLRYLRRRQFETGESFALYTVNRHQFQQAWR